MPQAGSEAFFRQLKEDMAAYSKGAGELRRMGKLVHGDLNGANILVDSESIVWVIDFAFTAPGHVLKDLAKLENTCLFEYSPSPPHAPAPAPAFAPAPALLVQLLPKCTPFFPMLVHPHFPPPCSSQHFFL